MRGSKRNPWLFGLGVLLAVLVVYGGHARADVTTDQSGSIIIFPKVIADGTRDTLIELTNTSNMPANVHCFYVNASGHCSVSGDSCKSDSDCPTDPVLETCDRQCVPNDFDLMLTAQQPTLWRVSTGRITDLFFPPPCRIGQRCACVTDPPPDGGQRCPGDEPGLAGQNSFAVPKIGNDFEGLLKCVQVDENFEMPVSQNSLKGEAVLETLESGQISEYNALSITAFPSGLNSNLDLHLLSPAPGAGVASGINEYNGCPTSLVLNHYADGAVDAFSGASVTTELTLIPCTDLIEVGRPTHAVVSFNLVDEFEDLIGSADAVGFDCFFNRRLGDIRNFFKSKLVGGAVPITSPFAKTRITVSSNSICYSGDRIGLECNTTHGDQGDDDCPNFETTEGGASLGCRPASAVLGVAEEFHSIIGRPDGTAAVNLIQEGGRTGSDGHRGDLIVVPRLKTD